MRRGVAGPKLVRLALGVAWCVAAFAAAVSSSTAQEYKSTLPADHPAIDYLRAPVDDAVARLSRRIESRELTLDSRPGSLGHLPALLEQLGLNTDSQMLVFSKTSVQAEKISPDNPRAIYFGDDVAVAYVPGGGIEVAAVDPTRGPIFYAMTPDASGRPEFRRTSSCLRCHHGPNTAGVPGLYVGSVIPNPDGEPLRDETAIITDHRSAFADRWGGWYVTARRGEPPDRANAVAANPADPALLVRNTRQNRPSLLGRFDPSLYLAQTSDIVALMTFEHQTQMMNFITRVEWQARRLQYESVPDSEAKAALERDIDEMTAYMLFSGEAPLVEPVEGVSSFTQTFPRRGPRDRRGRSLRDFDLGTRLFRYPLSYLIYSAAFDGLPASVRERLYRRLYDVLSGKDRRPQYAHLSDEDRRAILEILLETKPGLPAYWRDAD